MPQFSLSDEVHLEDFTETYESKCIKCIITSEDFSAMFHKNDNFYDFLFAFITQLPPSKMRSSKKRMCFFPFSFRREQKHF